MNDLMTKSFLNYADLKKQTQIDIETELSQVEASQMNPTDHQNLSAFFPEIDSIKSEMEEISGLLNDLETQNLESKTIYTPKLLRGFRDRMDTDTKTILRKVKSLRFRLESLDKSNAMNRRISASFREGGTVDRTRVAVTNALRIKFKDLISEFTTLRERIMQDHKDDMRRKYFSATGEVPSDEMVEKLVTGSLKIEVFETRVDLEENKERYEVVKGIQRSLDKLEQVFVDMAVLVEKQGEQIDDIEHNVVNAGEFIGGGANSLKYAHQIVKKKQNDNWLLWAAAILLIVLLLCLISVISIR